MSRAEDRDTTSSEGGRGKLRTRNEALIHLLGDDDSGIRIKAWRHLEKLGAGVLDSVESAAGGAEDPEVRKQAGRFLREHKRREVFKEWLQFCREPGTDLEKGSLLVARSEYPDLDPSACTEVLDGYASSLEGSLSCGQQGGVEALVELLAGELGFRGNGDEYYDADNSYLNRVIESRLGIPLSLSVVYLLVARRCGIDLSGVAMPRHFLLKFQAPGPGGGGGGMFVDPFNGGRLLDVKECVGILESSGEKFREEYLEAADDRAILSRMLGNLLNVYHSSSDSRRMNRVAAMLKLLQAPGM
ncbi:MAG: transglutaminase-like domain-containing protein [Planctomycetota bacterium]